MLVTWSKGHVWEPLLFSQYIAYRGVDTSCAGGVMYFICRVTQQDHSIEMSCVFMGESSSQHVTTLKDLVTIGKILHQKHESYKCVLPLKNWAEKNVKLKNCTLSKYLEIKKHIFTLMTTFYNFIIKIEASWVEEYQWRYYVCLVYLFSDKIKLKICNVKKNNSKLTNFTIKS